MSKPLVSVVIPAYNCESFIETTVRSVLEQSLVDFELIVVDDASTDATLQILQQLESEDSRIRVLSAEQNAGQAACRNRAVRAARGRYVAYLDADDIWLPQKLERQLEFMRSRALVFCYCGYGTIDEHGQVLIPDLKIPARTEYRRLLKSNTICPSSVIYDRTGMQDIVMPERPQRREDLISWLRVSEALGGWLYGISQPLCMVRRLPESSSSNKLRALRWQWTVYRGVLGFGLMRSLYYLANFAITSLAKRSSVSVALKRQLK